MREARTRGNGPPLGYTRGSMPRAQEAPAARRTLLVHPDVVDFLHDPRSDRQLQQRARLVFAQLVAHGMPPQVKSVQGAGRGWFRTDLGGNHGHQFYLWWARPGAPPVKHLALGSAEIVVRAVRHHDETPNALDAGDPATWFRFEGPGLRDDGLLPELAPSQVQALASTGRLRVLRGQPGTGKTTVLQQAALAVPGRRVLYLTHNARLAARAREHFDQFAPDPSRFTVSTFPALLRRVLREAPPETGSLADRIALLGRALDGATRKFPPWERHAEELFGELHAWIAGAALPFEFRGAPPCAGPLLSAEAFVRLRAKVLDERTARHAVQAVQLLDPRLLPEIVGDPWWARQALDRVAEGGRAARALDGTDAVFVDEVQDLTLVEAALVAALVRAAESGRDAPMDVTVAGDESQTVRPTDFDWGAFADVVHPALGAAATFDLLGNVRSPRVIATLVERSWSLYQHVGKAQRPRGRAELEVEDAVPGRVVRCRVPDAETFARVGRALLERPSTLLVYPGARVPDVLRADGVDVWSSDAAKGLDFAVVAVVDGARRLREIESFRAGDGGPVHALRARTRADQFRVALSRATDAVIFLDVGDDPAGDGALQRLCVDDDEGPLEGYTAAMSADELVAHFARDDASPQELVLEYLAEARALLPTHPRRALDRIRHARGLLGRADSRCGVRDISLGRDVQQTLGLAAWVCATAPDARDAAELTLEAHRALGAADLKWAARASTALRKVLGGGDGSHAEVLELLDDGAEWPAELPAGVEAVHRALRTWALARITALLPGALAARQDLVRAVDAVRDRLGADDPEMHACGDAVRRRVATLLTEEALARAALDLLRPLAPRAHDLEARCHEVLGDLRAASDAWERAGDLTHASSCARDVPDLDRALDLAVRTGSEAVAALRWAVALRDQLAAGAAVADALTDTERAYLTRLVDGAVGARASARRRRG